MTIVTVQLSGALVAPMAFDFAALAALPGQIADIGSVVAGRRGGAVRLQALLARAGVGDAASRLRVVSRDAQFSAELPLAAAAEALLVYRLGDAPLSAAAGGPVRFLIPNASACGIDGVDACANVKDVGLLQID